jgi:hypothetical protein
MTGVKLFLTQRCLEVGDLNNIKLGSEGVCNPRFGPAIGVS